MDTQMDAVEAAERDGNEYARKAADAWVSALRAAQTTIQATSLRGLMLQSIHLEIAVDGILGEPDIAAALAGASLRSKRRG